MSQVQPLLEETLATGELDRQLEQQHRRWRRLLDLGDFREAVLAKAWTLKEQFRGSTAGEFLAWVRRLGWSVGIDCWRCRQRETKLRLRLFSFLSRSWPAPSDAVATRDYVEWLLAGLTDRERKVLILKYYGHESAERIAETLGATVAAVHQLHYRALEKLRQRAKSEEGR